MYRSELFRVGIIAKAPTTVMVKETYHDEGESVFDNGNPSNKKYSTPESSNDYGVSSPWTFGAGVSGYIIPQLLLSADLELTDWTQMKFTDNQSLEKKNISMSSDFRSTASYRLGAEFEIPKTEIRLRGGYSLTPSPYKNDPSSFDQKMYTGGAGILLQRNVLLDGAVVFGSFKSFRNQYRDPNIIGVSRTDESISTTQVIMTLSYRF